MTPQIETIDPTIAAMVDELGALERDLAPFRTKISRIEALRKTLRTAYEADTSLAEIPLTGARYTAILGAPGNETVIDYKGLVKAIKPSKFARFATCTMKALKANVLATLFEEVTSVQQIGPRSLKVFERPTATPVSATEVGLSLPKAA